MDQPNTPPAAAVPSAPAGLAVPHHTVQDLTPEQQSFVNKFSWRALFLNAIYCFCMGLIVEGFLFFIPFYNVYMLFNIDIHGRRLSWEKGEWRDFATYEKRQKLMVKIAKIFLVIYAVFLVLYAVLVIWIFTFVFKDAFGAGSPSDIANKCMTGVVAGDTSFYSTYGDPAYASYYTPESEGHIDSILAGATGDRTSSVSVKNNVATTCGLLTTSDGTAHGIELQLVEANSSWMVAGFVISPDATCDDN